MEGDGRRSCSPALPLEENMELRRGPWTVEEDILLINYIETHSEGRWNYLARCAGLKRTGKSCRLRWLNYLRPDLRRGSLTPEEQLVILELHSRFGNRWSKIARHLPGRTDNEIKNYWRTRVQKHAKHLHCEVDSDTFRDAMRYLWIPHLVERIHPASTTYTPAAAAATTTTSSNTSLGMQSSSELTELASHDLTSPECSNLTQQLSSPPPILQRVEDDVVAGFSQPLELLQDFDQMGQLGGDLFDNLWGFEDFWFMQQ